MSIQSLKRLTFLLPISFIGLVLLTYLLLDENASKVWVSVAFLVLTIGTIFFTIWVFALIESREKEINRRTNQLSTLREASLYLTEELDLGEVLQRVVDQARILSNAKYGALGVLDEKKQSIDRFITSGLTPEQLAMLKAPPHGHGLLGALIHDGKSLRVSNISSDPRSVGVPQHHPPMHSLLGVPIKFKGEVLGDLYLTDKQETGNERTDFSDQDQFLLEMFASQAAIAIKNAQHYRQSQQLTLLQERERFGMDLHDGIIQSIYAVGLMLDDAQYQSDVQNKDKGIAQAIQGLNNVIGDIRNYILDLRPQRFQGRNLQEGLEELVREVRAHSFLDIDLQVEPYDWKSISPEITVEILHIAREALTNVRKHAHANKVDISLKQKSNNLVLEIKDNGSGFDVAKVQEKGNGLKNMRERTSSLGGDIRFQENSISGMSVYLLIPVL